jgi:short-subunit dehydrogenase
MTARRAGVVVNVCSVASYTTVPGMHHYNAAKAGLAAASETLRAELRGTGVHVLTVYPGPVKTALSDAGRAAYQETLLSRIFTPEGTTEVLARRVRSAVDARRDRLIYPRFYWVPRLFPGFNRLVTDRLTPPVRTPAWALPAASDVKSETPG